MKIFSRFLLFVLTIGTLLLSACGATPATPNVGSSKVEAVPVAFIGMVDSIAGDQWVINGQTITVDPAVIRDGPFNGGDQVKVEGVVNADGSFTVSRVESPTPQDVSSLPPFGNDNSNSSNNNDINVNANINDDNSNAVNSNDANLNDDNGGDVNSNDDNGDVANANDTNVNDDNGTNSNNDNGSSINLNSNTNDDQSGSGGNDNNGGGGNGGGSDDSGGGNDNGGGDD